MCETRLELVVAHLLVAGEALRAGTAAAHEGQRHALADFPAAHFLADLHDYPGQLVPGHVRQSDIRIVPHPAVPVAAADAVGFHLDDHAMRFRRWIGNVLDG